MIILEIALGILLVPFLIGVLSFISNNFGKLLVAIGILITMGTILGLLIMGQ